VSKAFGSISVFGISNHSHAFGSSNGVGSISFSMDLANPSGPGYLLQNQPRFWEQQCNWQNIHSCYKRFSISQTQPLCVHGLQ
jgi:hypothetical protein